MQLLSNLVPIQVPNKTTCLFRSHKMCIFACTTIDQYNLSKSESNQTQIHSKTGISWSPQCLGSNEAWICAHTWLQSLLMHINQWDFLFVVIGTHITFSGLCRISLCIKYWADTPLTLSHGVSIMHKTTISWKTAAYSPCSYATVLLKRREK